GRLRDGRVRGGRRRVRVPCGSRGEAHDEECETRGTPRLFRRDATGGVAPRAASDFTCHIWRVKSDAAGGVMGMCGASVPFPTSLPRAVPATSPRRDTVPAPVLPETSRPGRLGGGLSLPGSPPGRPGPPSPAAGARTLAVPGRAGPGPPRLPRQGPRQPEPGQPAALAEARDRGDLVA